MPRARVAQRGGVRVSMFTLLAIAGAAAVIGAAAAARVAGGGAARAAAANGFADSASFVPDDNRAFQFEIADGNGARSRSPSIAVSCGFYDRGPGTAEKRVVVYREAPASALFGIMPSGRWSPIAMCALPTQTRRFAGLQSSQGAAPAPRVVVQPTLTISLDRRRNGRPRDRVILVVAWARRPDGRWAQLERYSVLRQRAGVMYQFGDFRIGCCLDGASAYVARVPAPAE